MNQNIKQASACLRENNNIGMDSGQEPIHWNLHNAITLLIKAFEEENEMLQQRVDHLERQIRNIE